MKGSKIKTVYLKQTFPRIKQIQKREYSSSLDFTLPNITNQITFYQLTIQLFISDSKHQSLIFWFTHDYIYV